MVLIPLYGGRFWFARSPMPRDEMRRIAQFTNDGELCDERLVPTYALFALDVAKNTAHRFRVERCTNAIYDVVWSGNVETEQDDGQKYKMLVYKRLREWFEENEDECLGVDFKDPTEYWLWKGPPP